MKRKGFTLVELLAIIAILAILVIIALPNVLNLFNNAKVNTFKTEAIKAAQLAEQKFAFSNAKGSVDCKENLTGGGIKECTAIKQNNKVYADVLGDGAFSGFLMVNASSDGSGEFVDLNKLNTLKTPEVFKASLIESSQSTKINSKFTKLSTSESLKVITGEDTVDDTSEEVQAIKKILDSSAEYTVSNGYLKYSGNVENIKLDGLYGIYLFYSINIPKAGNYSLTFTAGNNWNIELGRLVKNDFNEIGEGNGTGDYEYISSNVNGKEYNLTINIKNPGIYKIMYVAVHDNNNINNDLNFLENIVIEGESSGESVVLNNASKDIYIKTSEVSSYKDDGILFNGSKLTKKNDFYAYSKLQNEEGIYTYNYIVKTTNGIRKLSRIINVSDATNGACFNYGLSGITFKINTKNCLKYFSKNGSNNNGSSSSGYNVCDKTETIAKLIEGNGRLFIKLLNAEVLEDVNYSKAVSKILSYYNNMYDESSNSACPKDVIIPSYLSVGKVTTVGENAIRQKGLTNLTIPSTVSKIERYSFAGNKLNSVTFKGNRNNINIDNCAFFGNSSIIGNEANCFS